VMCTRGTHLGTKNELFLVFSKNKTLERKKVTVFNVAWSQAI